MRVASVKMVHGCQCNLLNPVIVHIIFIDDVLINDVFIPYMRLVLCNWIWQIFYCLFASLLSIRLEHATLWLQHSLRTMLEAQVRSMIICF